MRVLRGGGNAVDAAVAAAWVLSVCEPSGSGLGGQTTALVRVPDGRIRIIDGHSHAPRGVSRSRVSRAQQAIGPCSCTVPTTPATLDYLVRKFGRLSPDAAIAPAARLADEGFAITPLYAKQIGWTARFLRRDEATARLFLSHGSSPSVGAIQRFPELAVTLRRLATQGVEDFYRGLIARAIADDMRLKGGLLDERDLDLMAGPTECDPLLLARGSHLAWTVPAPGGGATLLTAMQVLDGLGTEALDRYERRALASHAAFALRERPSLLTAEDGAVGRTLVRGLQPNAGRYVSAGIAEGPGETTHLTVADADGTVVCLTQSIQSLFGAKIANGALGFLYNNYLVTCPRRPHPAQLAGGCAVRSNAAPTLLTTSAAPHLPMLALGAAGSRRIITSLLTVIDDVMDRGLTVRKAIHAPRVHGLLDGSVWIERPAATEHRLRRLRRRFTHVLVKPRHHYGMGCVQAVHWTMAGTLEAAADPRREGTSMTIPGGER